MLHNLADEKAPWNNPRINQTINKVA